MRTGQNEECEFPQKQPPQHHNRDLYESNTHPFIIKIWLEEIATDSNQVIWRGHITHVPTGKRYRLKKLNDIITFITFYLPETDVNLSDQS